jgi:hypothetical protein
MKHGTESYHVWSLGHEKEQAYIRAQRMITTDVLGSISEVDDPLRITGSIHPYTSDVQRRTSLILRQPQVLATPV